MKERYSIVLLFVEEHARNPSVKNDGSTQLKRK